MEIINIDNDGQEITNTNYFSTEWYRNGVFAASVNAGALRILVPDSLLPSVAWDMELAKDVIISKGVYQGRMGYEVMFEDYSSSPYCLHFGDNQMISTGIADSEDGREDLVLAIWGRYDGEMRKLYQHTAKFRVVKSLPWLKEWKK